ncbi:MAG: hypothetical protein PHI83_08240 [Sphaerochaetaceae bacterium]|jgi:hypothetical protein|nr:hypothetical protein [Sphaerochaetaceae bacterium]
MKSQVFFLSVFYLILNGMFLLLYRYKGHGDFIKSLRDRLYAERKLEMGLVIFGFVVSVGSLAFPMDPGPVYIGDGLVAINSIILSVLNLYFFLQHKSSRAVQKVSAMASLAYWWYGVFLIVLGCLHFLFPSIVLI